MAAQEDPSPEQDTPPSSSPQGADGDVGIPEVAEGTPVPSSSNQEFDLGTPVGPAPERDFWDVLYTRRSIRRFKPDPVPRELLDQVMHAGIWAPSSCNYQMWDLVAVDDPETNEKLATLSAQMGHHPVNIVVSYGRDFSEEGSANVQSASAMIQNMSLAAHVLGLGTFWITQMGHAEKVREIVGLPYDRLVIAVLAIGWPKTMPKRGPKRRPLGQVTHYNHYAGTPIPSSVDPEDWDPELLTQYQRARVFNGLRHNKNKWWEERAFEEAIDELIPEGRERPKAGEEHVGTWLDVLPCTGLLTDKIGRMRGGYRYSIAERSTEVCEFVAARTRPRAEIHGWPASPGAPDAPPEGAFDFVSCFFRLEDLPKRQRLELVADMARWVKPGGHVLVAYIRKHSVHDLLEELRRKRGGPSGVEYVLAPDPNIGPFESLTPSEVEGMLVATGLTIERRLGLHAGLQPDELEFRTRNFSKRSKRIAHLLGKGLSVVEKFPGVAAKRGRYQFLLLKRPDQA